MDDTIQTPKLDPRDPDILPGADKSPWQRPDLRYLGRLGDLVQVSTGKTSVGTDGDMGGVKFPTGQNP